MTRASCAQPMHFWDSFIVTIAIFLGFSVIGVVTLVMRDAHKARKARQAAVLNSLRRNVVPLGKIGKSKSRAQVIGQHVLDSAAMLRKLRWPRVFKRLSQFWLICYPGVSVKLLRVCALRALHKCCCAASF